jgi:hypothetical protein
MTGQRWRSSRQVGELEGRGNVRESYREKKTNDRNREEEREKE